MKKGRPPDLLISCFVFVACIGLVSAQPSTDFYVYIGSYTNTTSKGIYLSGLNSTSGTLTPPVLVAEAVFPAQLWVAPSGRFLYAANWQGDDTTAGDTIGAYAIDRATGALSFINKVSGGGSGPNQVVVDPGGNVAVTVNYRSGSVAAFGLARDGRISDVADIGLDRVYTYHLDTAKRVMGPADPPYVAQPAGSGPRRLQLHPNGRFLYVNRETDSQVSVFAVGAGRLQEIQSISTLPAGYEGNNTTAEIVIDSAGRYLYVSNRGHGSIVVYAIDRAGRLSLVEHAPSGGRTPRNFSIDPTGRYLFSSNQDTEEIVLHRIDPATGRLTATSVRIAVANPGSIAFVRR